MIEEKDIQKLFIQEELSQHAEFLCDLFVEAIEEKKLIADGFLGDTFTMTDPSKVFERGTLNVLQFSFPNHGRFIEIRNSKKKIRSDKAETNELLWGIRKTRKKKGKNAQWYTRNVYGAQNRLIGRLMYGLGEKERERLINILNRQRKTTVKVNG